MRRSWLVIGALMAMVEVARAEAPSFQAELSQRDVTLDETVQLTLTLSRDSSQAYGGYARPDFKDFEVLQQAQGESTQWTLNGGQNGGKPSVRTVEEHVYVLKPRHKGRCVVPPATAKVGGREVKSQELVVAVSPAGKKVPPALSPPPTEPPIADPEALKAEDEVFIDARADKPTVYIGEQLLASWSLFTRSDILRYRSVTDPKNEDFWSEDLFQPQGALSWSRQTVKGQEYEVAPLLKRALFPLRSGRLQVTAMQVEVTTQQTLFWGGASAMRASRPLSVEVLALPAAGRPEGFETPNVGRFEVATTVDRNQLKAGDALTFKVIVRGEGNLRNVKLKKIEHIDGFKVYEPTVSEHVERGDLVRGDKTWSYLLLPEKGGALTIPAVEMPYFDPHEKGYSIARSSPVAVQVVGDPDKIGNAPTDAAKENVLARRILPIRNVHHVATRIGDRIVRGKLLWLALAAPPSLLFLFVVGGTLRAALIRETAGSKRRRARAAARRRMREAETHLKGQRPSKFFGACARAIYEHLEYRSNVKCEALTVAELRSLLATRGFDAATTEAVVRELEICDFARFAPSASGPGEMRAALGRVRELLLSIERARLTDATVAA